MVILVFADQSFTYLITDLRQTINSVSSFSRCPMKHFLEGLALLRVRHYISTQKRKLTNKDFHFEVTYQSLKGTLPSRKCVIIKAPAKYKTTVYVLAEF